ncbi:MAG TPA: chromate efflux transporter [Candidatus Binatus sp.]|uniref:chromate efflux transporter n=1 Tax=Candidatus Binatus sp. TaxID=2811406 RepID=UPI002F3FDF4C
MDESTAQNNPPARRDALWELAVLFLRLGTLAMGGPAAHIAMMEDEVVRRRRWMTHERFLDMLGVCNLIPGPNSTEMAIHIGQLRAGFAGLVVAGACFILPAAAIVLVIAWMYVRYGTMPQAVGLLYGIKPVIIAVVLQALWGLGRTAIKSRLLAAIAIVALAASLLDVNDMIVLLGGGIVMLAIRAFEDRDAARATLAAIPVAARASGAKGAALAAAAVAVPFSLTTLFLFYLKVGAVLFGSGYVLLAFLRTDLVDRLRWLTEAQLLDAVAVGQVTPGPVFTTATFIGYILGGFRGAVVATLGIFLPSFFFVSISGPLIPHLRRSPLAGAFLDGVNVGAWALMAAVTLFLAHDAIVDVTTTILALASAVVLIRYRVNSAWPVLAGGVIGLAMTLWR